MRYLGVGEVLTLHRLIIEQSAAGHSCAIWARSNLRLNGWRLVADIDDAERTILGVASGSVSREELRSWIAERIRAE